MSKKGGIWRISGITSGWLFFGMMIFLSLLFSSWLMFHTFSYDTQEHAILIGNKLWSDFGAHIPLIRSFSMGANLDRILQGSLPQYPLFSGESIRYHFLFYALVGWLEHIGIRIDWALNIPSIIGFAGLLISIAALAHILFGDKRITLLSILFTLFNGSLAFVRFFKEHPLSLRTPQEIAETVHFPAFAPWGPGDVSAFWNLNIYTNQRHLAGAFALGILFIITCIAMQKKPWRDQLLYGLLFGLLLGTLPFFHQSMLLLIGICIITYFLFVPKIWPFLITTGVISALVIFPQLLILRKGISITEWYPGYLIHNELSFGRFVWYWVQNLGMHFFLIPIGFLLAPPVARKFLFPLFLYFVIANLFIFSKEASANHKFFNFALILGNMYTAYALCFIADTQKQIHLKKTGKLLYRMIGLGMYAAYRALTSALVGILLLLLTLSGVIDFAAVANDAKGTLPDIASRPVAQWIASHTNQADVFLTSSFFFHPATITGRSIYMGWPYFAWSLGYDTFGRAELVSQIFTAQTKGTACPLLQSQNIQYIVLNTKEKPDPNLPKISELYTTDFSSLYSDPDGFIILSIAENCPQ